MLRRGQRQVAKRVARDLHVLGTVLYICRSGTIVGGRGKALRVAHERPGATGSKA